jgi:hypothetical protein
MKSYRIMKKQDLEVFIKEKLCNLKYSKMLLLLSLGNLIKLQNLLTGGNSFGKCKHFGKCVVTGGKENLAERNLSMFTHLLSFGLERFLREILFVTLSYIWICGILIPTIMTF